MLHRGLKDLKYLLADFFMFVFSVGTKPSHRHLCSSEGALDPKPKRSFASALHLAPDCLLKMRIRSLHGLFLQLNRTWLKIWFYLQVYT